MIKRLGSWAAVVAVAALTAGSVAPATGSGSGSGGGWTIRVVSVNTEEAFIDVGEPDFSLGDQFVFSSNLKRYGERVGHSGVVCTITSVSREESQCVGTVRLRRGQIAVQGLIAGSPGRFALPVTGGSGAFEGVGGEMHVRERSGGREVLLFHLSR